MADIFLSYAREDRAFAQMLSRALEGAGLSVWWDSNMVGGARFHDVIQTELDAAQAVVVVWSRASVTSHWVADEAEVGRDTGRLAPICIDGTTPPLGFRQFQVVDFAAWNGGADARPMRSLVAALEQIRPAARDAPKSSPDMRPRTPTLAVAVLPFANLSSDPEQEYFSDGLSEELITQLSHIEGLRLAGRTSSFAFKGRATDFRTIGEQLGVSHVLEGSVRRAGQRLRINVQFSACADGLLLWSERYDRELVDVFQIQDEIAEAVAGALSLALGVGAPKAVGGATSDVVAHDRYLQARALYHRRGGDDLVRAIEIFREVVRAEPDYIPAWRGLFSAHLSTLVWLMDWKDALAEMDEAGERMRALAPTAWQTHALHADQLMLRHDWAGADAASLAALAAAPFEVDALVTRATFLGHVGRAHEAVDHFERARAADPLSLGVSGLLQLFLDVAGRAQEAQAEFERGRSLEGDHNRWDWAALLRAWSSFGLTGPAMLAAATPVLSRRQGLHWDMLPVLDDPPSAVRVLRAAFEDPANQSPGTLTALAIYADHFGDPELALSALRRSIVEMNKANLEGLWWPFETGLRRDPAFRSIVSSIGLPAYWRSSGHWGEFARSVGEDDFEIFR